MVKQKDSAACRIAPMLVDASSCKEASIAIKAIELLDTCLDGECLEVATVQTIWAAAISAIRDLPTAQILTTLCAFMHRLLSSQPDERTSTMRALQSHFMFLAFGVFQLQTKSLAGRPVVVDFLQELAKRVGDDVPGSLLRSLLAPSLHSTLDEVMAPRPTIEFEGAPSPARTRALAPAPVPVPISAPVRTVLDQSILRSLVVMEEADAVHTKHAQARVGQAPAPVPQPGSGSTPIARAGTYPIRSNEPADNASFKTAREIARRASNVWAGAVVQLPVQAENAVGAVPMPTSPTTGLPVAHERARLQAKQAKADALAMSARQAALRAGRAVQEADEAAEAVKVAAASMPGSYAEMEDGDGIVAAAAVQLAASRASAAAAMAGAAKAEAEAVWGAAKQAAVACADMQVSMERAGIEVQAASPSPSVTLYTAYAEKATLSGPVAPLDSTANSTGPYAGTGSTDVSGDQPPSKVRSRLGSLVGQARALKVLADRAGRAQGRVANRAAYRAEAEEDEAGILNALAGYAGTEAYLQEQEEDERSALRSLGAYAGTEAYLHEQQDEESAMMAALATYADQKDERVVGPALAVPNGQTARLAGLVGQARALKVLADRAGRAQGRVANRAAYRAEAEEDEAGILNALAGYAGTEAYLQEQEEDERSALRSLGAYAEQERVTGLDRHPHAPPAVSRKPTSETNELASAVAVLTSSTSPQHESDPAQAQGQPRIAALVVPAQSLHTFQKHSARAQERVATRAAFHEQAEAEIAASLSTVSGNHSIAGTLLSVQLADRLAHVDSAESRSRMAHRAQAAAGAASPSGGFASVASLQMRLKKGVSTQLAGARATLALKKARAAQLARGAADAVAASGRARQAAADACAALEQADAAALAAAQAVKAAIVDSACGAPTDETEALQAAAEKAAELVKQVEQSAQESAGAASAASAQAAAMRFEAVHACAEVADLEVRVAQAEEALLSSQQPEGSVG